jgi:hypothetical protein
MSVDDHRSSDSTRSRGTGRVHGGAAPSARRAGTMNAAEVVTVQHLVKRYGNVLAAPSPLCAGLDGFALVGSVVPVVQPVYRVWAGPLAASIHRALPAGLLSALTSSGCLIFVRNYARRS